MPYWRLYYHFIWSTRNRHPLIDSSWEDDLHNAIASKAVRLGGVVHAVGGTDDHIHLAVSVPPSTSLASCIGQIKGNSAHFVNNVLTRDFEFRWQSEYGVVSFGGKQLDMVVRYVKRQRQHHSDASLISFLEQAS